MSQTSEILQAFWSSVGNLKSRAEQRERRPALGQVAVLGLEAVVVGLPVGVARGQVRDLVARRALAVGDAGRHPPVQAEGCGGEEEPAARFMAGRLLRVRQAAPPPGRTPRSRPPAWPASGSWWRSLWFTRTKGSSIPKAIAAAQPAGGAIRPAAEERREEERQHGHARRRNPSAIAARRRGTARRTRGASRASPASRRPRPRGRARRNFWRSRAGGVSIRAQSPPDLPIGDQLAGGRRGGPGRPGRSGSPWPAAALAPAEHGGGAEAAQRRCPRNAAGRPAGPRPHGCAELST